VLLADDTAAVRLLIRRTLEACGTFDVVAEVGDGREAVARAAALQPDLVLLDLAMPVMDGLEAIPLIRRCSPRSRIVVLSGFGADQMAARALAAGASAYLEKRYAPDEFLDRLFDACGAPRPATSAPETPDPFQVAFDRAPIGMALLDHNGRFLRVNAALCRVTGHDQPSLLARRVADVIAPDHAHAEQRLRERLGAGSATGPELETGLVRPDGRPVWVLISYSLVPDVPPRPGQIVAHVVDITAEKRTVAGRVVADRERSQFADLAAHELKSPLQAISGFAHLLERVHGPALGPEGREFLGRIVDGSLRMNAVIDGLLEYRRVDAGDLALEPTALDDLVDAAMARTRLDTVGAPPEVVRSGRLPVVDGDPGQLGQLLHHLLANAVKFVSDGTSPRVHVSAERGREGWILTVADNGIGVDSDRRNDIFKLFARVHPRERYAGTGIGLAICQRIVERRGGTIWVEANPGGGSRFRFTIPDKPPGIVRATHRTPTLTARSGTPRPEPS
jgi:PAS domain S-box-containing protein